MNGREVTVEKTIAIDGAQLSCDYKLTAPGEPFGVFFAPELNLTLLAGDAPDRFYRAPVELGDRRLASRGESEGRSSWSTSGTNFLARMTTRAGDHTVAPSAGDRVAGRRAASSAPTRAR